MAFVVVGDLARCSEEFWFGFGTVEVWFGLVVEGRGEERRGRRFVEFERGREEGRVGLVGKGRGDGHHGQSCRQFGDNTDCKQQEQFGGERQQEQWKW